MNNYVLKHNFGYGNADEYHKIKKLKLRNLEDLDDYIVNIVSSLFVAIVNEKVVQFTQNTRKTEIVIERV